MVALEGGVCWAACRPFWAAPGVAVNRLPAASVAYCAAPQACPVPSPELGTLEKADDTAYHAQLPRACYLVLGCEEPGAGWRLVALQLGPRRLLLLLSPQSPTHGLRDLASRTLQALTPLL